MQGFVGLYFLTSLVKSYLQITHHPTLDRLLPAWVHWTHHGYGFCNMARNTDVSH